MKLAAFLLVAAQLSPAPAPPTAIDTGRPRVNLGSYFSTDDYPVMAWIGEEEGTVRFRLAIDPEGRVSACEVTETSGSLSLDQRTCEILTLRARYNPARDATGAPASGTNFRLRDLASAARSHGTGRLRPTAGATALRRSEALFRHARLSAGCAARPRGRNRRLRCDRPPVRTGSGLRRHALERLGRTGRGTCAIFFTRVRYTPAQESAVQPTTGKDIRHVTWRLPG